MPQYLVPELERLDGSQQLIITTFNFIQLQTFLSFVNFSFILRGFTPMHFNSVKKLWKVKLMPCIKSLY